MKIGISKIFMLILLLAFITPLFACSEIDEPDDEIIIPDKPDEPVNPDKPVEQDKPVIPEDGYEFVVSLYLATNVNSPVIPSE